MNKLLEVKNLKVRYPVKAGLWDVLSGKEQKYVHAVNDIDFSIKSGEILSFVGESGSGKTTMGKAVVQLLDRKNISGKVYFRGENILNAQKEKLKTFRQAAQIIFQDPYQSLNPKNTVFQITAEPLEINGLAKNEEEKRQRVKKALEQAGLKPAEDFMNRYPHELSGGQRQRVAIAGALVMNPSFIVADEPVSMLDVSIRADILKLMVKHKNEEGISYLFITHDLSLAWVISDRIAIMYLGKIMEIGSSDDIIMNPSNPYSKALIDVMPRMEPRRGKKRNILQGETPNPIDLPSGCVFHPRCPSAKDICRMEEPVLKQIGTDHFAACHLI